jgi:hypothetical protein
VLSYRQAIPRPDLIVFVPFVAASRGLEFKPEPSGGFATTDKSIVLCELDLQLFPLIGV